MRVELSTEDLERLHKLDEESKQLKKEFAEKLKENEEKKNSILSNCIIDFKGKYIKFDNLCETIYAYVTRTEYRDGQITLYGISFRYSLTMKYSDFAIDSERELFGLTGSNIKKENINEISKEEFLTKLEKTSNNFIRTIKNQIEHNDN